jgi:hypothetical protein
MKLFHLQMNAESAFICLQKLFVQNLQDHVNPVPKVDSRKSKQ